MVTRFSPSRPVAAKMEGGPARANVQIRIQNIKEGSSQCPQSDGVKHCATLETNLKNANLQREAQQPGNSKRVFES